jgi:hypothetical protein
MYNGASRSASDSQFFECVNDSKSFLFPPHPNRIGHCPHHLGVSSSPVYLPRALRKGRKLYDYLKDIDFLHYPWISKRSGVKHLPKFNLGIEVEVASVNNISRYGIVVFAKPSINFSVKMCAY